MGLFAGMRGLKKPRWGRRARVVVPVSAGVITSALLALFLFSPVGCGFNAQPPTRTAATPTIRVRLMQAVDSLTLTASAPPTYRVGSDPAARTLKLPHNTAVALTLGPGGAWRVGNTPLGAGVLTLAPAGDGTLGVAVGSGAAANPNNGAHRGQYRCVPSGPAAPGKFDVINDVDLEGYLAGVLPKELLKGWHDETYKAQAIVARTYALYEKGTAPPGRAWDVFPDTRSQMYGGIGAETEKSRKAVNDTAGVVVAYGPPGQEHVFEAYFSSCCGGITQSAADAFGEPFQEPLSDQNNHAICNASPSFNWGPVVIKKDELTRRLRAWGVRRQRPEKDMAPVSSVAIQFKNAWGRPTRFEVVDAKGNKYSLTGEEFRWSVNTDAENDPAKLASPGAAGTLKSSFVKVITDSDAIHFVEGHGWGHGVGMCQWCAQRRAEEGMHCEDIVLAAFQHARLVRAY